MTNSLGDHLDFLIKKGGTEQGAYAEFKNFVEWHSVNPIKSRIEQYEKACKNHLENFPVVLVESDRNFGKFVSSKQYCEDVKNIVAHEIDAVYNLVVEFINKKLKTFKGNFSPFPVYAGMDAFKTAHGLKSLLMVGGAMVATWAASQFAAKDQVV